MKIIEQSQKVFFTQDEDLVKQVERFGRICYKSEDKITKDSATAFVSKVIKKEHNSVLEMGAITVDVSIKNHAEIVKLLNNKPKYLVIDYLNSKEKHLFRLLISGTIRAFREFFGTYHESELSRMIIGLLKRGPLSVFFIDLPGEMKPADVVRLIPQKSIAKMFGEYFFLRHYHVYAKFYTNRAVTHEIVRHRPCNYLQESQRYCRYSESKFGNEVTFIKPTKFFAEDSEEYELWKRCMGQCEAIYLELLKTSSPQAARTVLPNSCKTEIIVGATIRQWMHIFTLRTSAAAEPSMQEAMNPVMRKFSKFMNDMLQRDNALELKTLTVGQLT